MLGDADDDQCQHTQTFSTQEVGTSRLAHGMADESAGEVLIQANPFLPAGPGVSVCVWLQVLKRVRSVLKNTGQAVLHAATSHHPAHPTEPMPQQDAAPPAPSSSS